MNSDHDVKTLAGIRAIVVNGDATIRIEVHRMLASLGCAVESAVNVREARLLLVRKHFDVAIVIMDRRQEDTPQDDTAGMTLIKESRNIWPWLGCVVLASSGAALSASATPHAVLGNPRILETPLEITTLADAVMEEVARRRRKKGEDAGACSQRQSQMRILSRLSEIAGSADTHGALHSLGHALCEALSCDLIGFLSASKGNHLVSMSIPTPVSGKFLECAEEEMIKQFEALGGPRLDRAELRVLVDGVATSREGPSEPGRMLTIPLVSDNDIHGVWLLASASASGMDNMDVIFLHYVASALSSVLTAVNRMHQLTARDGMTGLYNRSYLEGEMQRAWLLSCRHDYEMAIAIMDIDHFKTLNDTHGHLVGDQVLKEFATLLCAVARETDIVGRYGGDEFVVILTQTDAAHCAVLGDRIVKAVQQHTFCADTVRINVTVSVGVATSRNIRSTDQVSEVMSLADLALYAAKQDGRNRVRTWVPDRVTSDKIPPPHGISFKEGNVSERGRIFLVDDDQSIVQILQRQLQHDGYSVCTDTSAADALRRVNAAPHSFDVVITDLDMPELNGIEMIEALHSCDRDVMVIVLTGLGTKESAIECLSRGAFDFLDKPVTHAKIRASVAKALEHRRLRIENKRYQLRLEEMVRQKREALSKALAQLKDTHGFMLQALAGLLDAREHGTGEHSIRVRDIAIVMGRTLGLAAGNLDVLAQAALLHDIGKIAVPDAILLKPGALNEDEWRIMWRHPEVGYNILRMSRHLAAVAEVVYSHQERFDGSGYPRGLNGSQICWEARIFAVVDSYDAMRSDRPYRKALAPWETLEEIRKSSGTLYDPDVVAALCRNQTEVEQIGAWESIPSQPQSSAASESHTSHQQIAGI